MADPITHCVPYSCPSSWIPRSTWNDFHKCEPYTTGMYVQPCELPFQNMPPLFLASFFGCLLGLAALFWSCREPKGAAEATQARGAPAAMVETLGTTRHSYDAQL